MRISLGEHIKELRLAKKMTLSVVAERVGVTVSSVAAYENGSRKPSLDVLLRLSRLFHVSVDNLLGGSDKYTVDISGLSQTQRDTLQEMAATFKRHNHMYRQLTRSEDIEDFGLLDGWEEG